MLFNFRIQWHKLDSKDDNVENFRKIFIYSTLSSKAVRFVEPSVLSYIVVVMYEYFIVNIIQCAQKSCLYFYLFLKIPLSGHPVLQGEPGTLCCSFIISTRTIS